MERGGEGAIRRTRGGGRLFVFTIHLPTTHGTKEHPPHISLRWLPRRERLVLLRVERSCPPAPPWKTSRARSWSKRNSAQQSVDQARHHYCFLLMVESECIALDRLARHVMATILRCILDVLLLVLNSLRCHFKTFILNWYISYSPDASNGATQQR